MGYTNLQKSIIKPCISFQRCNKIEGTVSDLLPKINTLPKVVKSIATMLRALVIRPVAMGWGMRWQIPSQRSRISAFCHPWRFLATFYCCFTCVGEERSEILVGLGLAWSFLHTRKCNLFLHTHSLFDYNKMKYEISSQILRQVIHTGQFYHP